MKVGTQHSTTDDVLKVLAAFGVNNICSTMPSATFDEKWSVNGLKRLRERVESFGIKLEAVPLPLRSAYIARAENPVDGPLTVRAVPSTIFLLSPYGHRRALGGVDFCK
jgi:D-mannonate dehydratase